MWMEMVEPYLIWMKLFDVMDQSFPPLDRVPTSAYRQSKKMGLPLVEFTLKSFKFTDEEIKHMHLPLVLTAMTQKLQVIHRRSETLESDLNASLFVFTRNRYNMSHLRKSYHKS
jgi:hypothetical protein